jgi:hypothetical protein
MLLLLAASFALAATTVVAQPYYAPGAYQGWTLPQNAVELKDDGTGGDVTAADGVYSASVVIAAAGVYEWKAATTDWTNAWPGSGNCWFITTGANESVLLTFDANAAGDGWAPDQFWPHSDKTRGTSYKVVGSLQTELGDANDWDPVGGTLVLHDDGLGGDAAAADGIYTYCGNVSTAGTHEWKVAVNADWAQQFGTDGASINASTWFVTVANDGDPWCFELDTNRGRIRAFESQAVAVEGATWGATKELFR